MHRVAHLANDLDAVVAYSLGEEYENDGRDNSIVPCIRPVAPVVRGACTDIANDSTTDESGNPSEELPAVLLPEEGC